MSDELREITLAVAREVMRWQEWTGKGDWNPPAGHEADTMFRDWGDEWGLSVYENGDDDVSFYFQPCVEIEDAWRVVERMRDWRESAHTTLRMVAYPYGRTYASFRGHETDDWCEANSHELPGHGNPTALAICRAALEVVRKSSGQSSPANMPKVPV